MGIVNKKVLVIMTCMLVLIEISSLYLMYKSSTNKNTQLDSVSLKQELNSPEMFAIMLEQSDGTYKESTSTSWPTDMMYNTEKSGCIDNNGNKLEGILAFDSSTNTATVEANNTSYCYLYFDSPPDDLNKLCSGYNSISECITNAGGNIEFVSDIWQSTLEDDGIRYVGTNPNNYVCFGTTDTNTCTGDTDKYMYRIIGFFEDSNGVQHMKLIKKEALNSAKAWNAVYNTDVAWDASDVYKGLNGSYFLTDTTNYPYMAETTWTDKIATWDYTATNTKTYENYSANSVYGPSYYYTSVRTIYLHELNRSGKANETCYYNSSTTADCTVGTWTTVPAKIGLMYASDYALSLGESVLDYRVNSYYSTLKTGWMHLSNNDSATLSTTAVAPPSPNEWTMSRHGTNSFGYYGAWYVFSTGVVSNPYVNGTYSVRSVFYLTENIKITSGKGSITEPYIIS